jgi:alkanesulfonate monooxygenase SsuD/methylene tetrahydromethanopterin reductase-like flavin-dependent oxidoreductase (luciferase family)
VDADSRVEFGFVVTAAGAPGASDREMYRDFLTDCELYGGLGYRHAWLLEHHFSDYFPTPDPMVLMAHLCGRFPELSYGTCVIVTPWHDPLRLAGQIAMVSQLSEHEMLLGLGRGTAKYEFDAFGLDMAEARGRFKETYEILRLALEGEVFSYEGEFLSARKPIRVRPQPRLDRVEFYGAIGSPDSAAIMGRLGLLPLCTSIGDLDKQAAALRNWEEASGRRVGEARCPIMVDCIVCDTDAEAVAEACELKPRYMQAQIDHYTPDVTDWENTPGYEAWKQIFAGMKARTRPEGIVPWTRWQLIGSPDTVAERLREFMRIGFNHFILQFSTPGVPVEVRRRWATAFAEEVAPRFSAGFSSPAVGAAAK